MATQTARSRHRGRMVFREGYPTSTLHPLFQQHDLKSFPLFLERDLGLPLDLPLLDLLQDPNRPYLARPDPNLDALQAAAHPEGHHPLPVHEVAIHGERVVEPAVALVVGQKEPRRVISAMRTADLVCLRGY